MLVPPVTATSRCENALVDASNVAHSNTEFLGKVLRHNAQILSQMGNVVHRMFAIVPLSSFSSFTKLQTQHLSSDLH